jgi:hypothetical protein
MIAAWNFVSKNRKSGNKKTSDFASFFVKHKILFSKISTVFRKVQFAETSFEKTFWNKSSSDFYLQKACNFYLSSNLLKIWKGVIKLQTNIRRYILPNKFWLLLIPVYLEDVSFYLYLYLPENTSINPLLRSCKAQISFHLNSFFCHFLLGVIK